LPLLSGSRSLAGFVIDYWWKEVDQTQTWFSMLLYAYCRGGARRWSHLQRSGLHTPRHPFRRRAAERAPGSYRLLI
jgi:hypothetical protein